MALLSLYKRPTRMLHLHTRCTALLRTAALSRPPSYLLFTTPCPSCGLPPPPDTEAPDAEPDGDLPIILPIRASFLPVESSPICLHFSRSTSTLSACRPLGVSGHSSRVRAGDPSQPPLGPADPEAPAAKLLSALPPTFPELDEPAELWFFNPADPSSPTEDREEPG